MNRFKYLRSKLGLLQIVRWPHSQRYYRFLIFLSTILVISWLYPLGDQFEYRYDLNEITQEIILAPFNFPVLKGEEVLENERETARRGVPQLFRRDPQISADQLNGLKELFARVLRIRQAEAKLAQSRERVFRDRYNEGFDAAQQAVVRDSTNLIELGAEFAQRFPLDLNSSHWGIFFKGKTLEGRTINYRRLQNELETIVRDVLTEGVLELPKRQLGDARVAVSSEGVEATVESKFLLDQDEAWAKAKTRLQAQHPSDATVESSVAEDLIYFFIPPNLIYDAETTRRRQEEAVAKVPISKGFVLRNERIVDANTRVTEEILEKINSLAAAKSQMMASAGGIQLWLPRIGMVMITTALLVFFYAWMHVYRREWFKNTRFFLLTNLLFILILAMGSIFHVRFGLSEYLIPFTVAAMAFTILFDARTAMIATITLALMMGFLVGNRVDFVLINLLAGSVAIYAVRQLRHRRQIFMAIIYIISAYAIGITAIEFLKYNNLVTLGQHLMYASINGLLSPIMVYGLVGVLEVIFGITTNLTLLELSDFNHPLLRRLARDANGTFSHSIVVGNLTESAANAIGANSLLCRVGAYYHDIGKLARSEYFIENQFHQDNPHDTIAPHLSAKVVMSHVKEGLRLAKEYGLPKGVADFIPMHHGTARIEYFYQKAVKENGGPENVKEQSFRYAGPKPNTKETGIIMLCEAIEAATRSIKKPTLARIQQMIDTIIEIRMADGQLDDCPLTLKDLNMIKGDARAGTGIISVLKGIYHVRIPYPSTDREAPVETRAREDISHATLFSEVPTE